MKDIIIRYLEEDDVEDFKKIRLEALKNRPDAFGAAYEQEVDRDIDFFQEKLDCSIVIAAYNDDKIIGVSCCLLNNFLKFNHVAKIWGVYLKEQYAGQGIARSMFAEILEELPESIEQIRVNVGSHNDKAKKLYEFHGFKEYGYEERILKVDGQYYDEVLMVKFLDK